HHVMSFFSLASLLAAQARSHHPSAKSRNRTFSCEIPSATGVTSQVSLFKNSPESSGSIVLCCPTGLRRVTPRPGTAAISGEMGMYRPLVLPYSPERRSSEMRFRRAHGRALLVMAVALAVATGCSSGKGAAGAPSLEKTNLNVAVVPAVDSAGFFV